MATVLNTPYSLAAHEPDTPRVCSEPIRDGSNSSGKLDDLSVAELKAQQEEIQRKLIEKQRTEKLGVIEQIIDVMRTYKVTTEELVEALGGFKPKRKGVKAPAKYRDPNTGVTWSGRGKEPLWLKGRDRNKFLIED